MIACTIYHTGVRNSADGVIKDHKVYLKGKGKKLYFPKEMFMAREECEGGLIQFEVEGKWGYADIYSGEIVIEPVWDFAGPFYSGYAHVALDVQLEIQSGYPVVEGGKHGYIDTDGAIVIPLEYDDAMDIQSRNRAYFKVYKAEKWGLVDVQNKILIPFLWDHIKNNYRNDLIFCALLEPEPTKPFNMKWGIYDKAFNLIVQPELDEEPLGPMIKMNPKSKSCIRYEDYYVLKKGNKYGILCEDSRWIANIKLTKIQAKAMLNAICKRRVCGCLYI